MSVNVEPDERNTVESYGVLTNKKKNLGLSKTVFFFLNIFLNTFTR